MGAGVREEETRGKNRSVAMSALMVWPARRVGRCSMTVSWRFGRRARARSADSSRMRRFISQSAAQLASAAESINHPWFARDPRRGAGAAPLVRRRKDAARPSPSARRPRDAIGRRSGRRAGRGCYLPPVGRLCVEQQGAIRRRGGRGRVIYGGSSVCGRGAEWSGSLLPASHGPADLPILKGQHPAPFGGAPLAFEG